jgi:hypothetical protein
VIANTSPIKLYHGNYTYCVGSTNVSGDILVTYQLVTCQLHIVVLDVYVEVIECNTPSDGTY